MYPKVLLSFFILTLLLSLPNCSSVPSSPTSDGVQSQNDQPSFMDVHNQARAQVGAPPLKWSQELADFAQEWADHLARRNEFKHNPESSFGENIAFGTNINAETAAQLLAPGTCGVSRTTYQRLKCFCDWSLHPNDMESNNTCRLWDSSIRPKCVRCGKLLPSRKYLRTNALTSGTVQKKESAQNIGIWN